MSNRRVEISDLNYFLTLPGEEIIVSKRQHWLVILPNILLTLGLLATFLVIFYYLHTYTGYPLRLLILASMLLWSITGAIITKIIVDWYHHFYIVTTRKIMEVHCSPFYWDKIDDVFLDQVRTTEVDIKINNVFQELFNIGDVIISFDRPSHDKLFILSCIQGPHDTGMLLGRQLEFNMQSSPVWFKRDKSNEVFHSEDVESLHDDHNGHQESEIHAAIAT